MACDRTGQRSHLRRNERQTSSTLTSLAATQLNLTRKMDRTTIVTLGLGALACGAVYVLLHERKRKIIRCTWHLES